MGNVIHVILISNATKKFAHSWFSPSATIAHERKHSNPQSMPMKAVELGRSSTLQKLNLDMACWYLNGSSLHDEYDYLIIILIQVNTDISNVFGTGMVNIAIAYRRNRKTKAHLLAEFMPSLIMPEIFLSPVLV